MKRSHAEVLMMTEAGTNRFHQKVRHLEPMVQQISAIAIRWTFWNYLSAPWPFQHDPVQDATYCRRCGASYSQNPLICMPWCFFGFVIFVAILWELMPR